jgi:hypothetical protein
MEWKGTFRCDACSRPEGKVASQPVLRALVNSDLEVVAVATFAEPAQLGALGRASTLSLAAKQPDFDNNRLTSSIKLGLALVGTAKVTRVMGNWTTEWRVLQNVSAKPGRRRPTGASGLSWWMDVSPVPRALASRTPTTAPPLPW